MSLDETTFWTTRFRDLPQRERWARLDASQDLLNQVQWYRGDPALSAWEEGFLLGMKNILVETRGMARISAKQWVRLRQIQEKLADDRADLEADPDYDSPTC